MNDMQSLKRKFNRRRMFTFTVLSLLAIMPMFIGVVSAATISPSSGQVIVGLPNQFLCAGLNASLTYDIDVDGVETYSSVAPSSGGEIIFSVTFTVEGNHNVVVTLDSDDVTVTSASVYALDIIAYFIGFLTIVFVIVLVVKIFNRAGDLV